MIYRQQILMALVQEFSGRIASELLHPLLFLYCREFVPHHHYYDFINASSSPLSLQAQEDKKTLVRKKLLEDTDDWVAVAGIKRFAVDLDFFEKTAFQKMKNAGWMTASREALLTHIAAGLPPSLPIETDPAFFTIGYEGRTPEAYLNLLVQSGVRLLCDVRKNAYSQKFGFSKAELKAGLQQVGIEYLHLPELGIQSEKRQQLETAQDYQNLFEEYDNTTLREQGTALHRLMQLAQQYGRIAITCFEKDMQCCHRGRIAATFTASEDFSIPIKHL